MTIEIDPDVFDQIADMHAVYRMFDSKNRLLYVGTTGRARRFDEHAVKRWFPAVQRISLNWHASEAEARLAESLAIKDEHPRFNIAGALSAKLAEHPTQNALGLLAGSGIALPKSDRSILADLVDVFGNDRGMHWATAAARLAAKFPDDWAGVTQEVVSTQCRSLGIRSVDVHVDGRVLKGCRRTDCVTASALRPAAGSRD